MRTLPDACGGSLTAAITPLEAIAVWPRDLPLFILHSGGGHPRWGRWSILTMPDFAAGRLSLREASTAGDPLASLQAALATTSREHDSESFRPDVAPFQGGWIGWFGYDLGRMIEPTAQSASPPQDDRGWPVMELAYCPAALAFDHLAGEWSLLGDAARAKAMWRRVGERAATCEPSWRVGDAASSFAPDDYLAAVARTKELIAQGDIFQANITQRFSMSFSGSTRALAAAAFTASGARYGAYLEMPDGRAVISMSPELFLEVDGVTRSVRTRPIKGTRAAGVLSGSFGPSGLSGGAEELRRSAKDAAELNMITDLMRNDLGRVCEFGSVRVETPREIESHPTVHHGVSEVVGRLRKSAGFCDLLRATFPPGSVTGAPKIRAMQVIDEIEPVRRGPYCGAIGFIGDDGGATLSVAIRTICLSGERPAGRWDALEGTLDYGAGGGIVADSLPIDEYRESLAKTEVLRLALGGPPVNNSTRQQVNSSIR